MYAISKYVIVRLDLPQFFFLRLFHASLLPVLGFVFRRQVLPEYLPRRRLWHRLHELDPAGELLVGGGVLLDEGVHVFCREAGAGGADDVGAGSLAEPAQRKK